MPTMPGSIPPPTPGHLVEADGSEWGWGGRQWSLPCPAVPLPTVARSAQHEASDTAPACCLELPSSHAPGCPAGCVQSLQLLAGSSPAGQSGRPPQPLGLHPHLRHMEEGRHTSLNSPNQSSVYCSSLAPGPRFPYVESGVAPPAPLSSRRCVRLTECG